MEKQNILPPDWFPEYPDPRVEGYPLMDSFWASTLISVAYFVIVWAWVKIAKSYQQKSKAVVVNENSATPNGNKSSIAKPSQAFNYTKAVMFAYNLIMVIYSSFMVVETIYLLYVAGYGLGCVPLDPTDNALQRRFIRVGYMFYISKFIELLDTFFFLWRGKFDQVSFLHVFHHGAMPPSIYWGVKYAPGGIVFMFPLGNSFVHVIMYTYYALSVLGAHRYLWWKRYLTALQMIQFVIFIVHQGQVFTINRDCSYPKAFPFAIIVYAIIFLILFGNFYVQAYWRRRRLAKRIRSQSEEAKKETSVLHHENGYANGSSNGYVKTNGTTTQRRNRAV